MTVVESTSPISLTRKIALGGGDFGLNIYWVCTSVFLLFYYTEALGLSPTIGGSIYMVALIWDAAIDPIVGAIAERTNSRFGRYRPYLMFGPFPLALAFISVFVLPAHAAGLMRIVLATASLLVFRTFYAVIAIPYATLFAQVTNDSRERATMAGIRMAFAFASGVLVAGISLPLSRWLSGWAALSTAYAICSCLFLWAAAYAIGVERDRTGDIIPPSGVGATIRAMVNNRALAIVLGIVLLTSFSGTFFSKNVLYFFKYARHDADFGGAVLAASAGIAAITSLIWAKIARLIGKRNTLLTGLAINAMGMVLWLVARDGSYPFLFIAILMASAGVGATYVCFWSMLPDTIEYGEWHSGVRTEGVMFGTVIFIQKAALGLGAGGLGIALGLIGLVPGGEQSPKVLDRLVQLMTFVPLTGTLLMFALAWLYPIDVKTHRRLLEALAERAVAANLS